MLSLTRDEVVFLARKSLEIEENSEELPEWYLAAFIEYVKARPNDTNFIIEFAKPGRGGGIGGDGFGIATCLEEHCWSDVRLGADPTLADGGRSHGFGSFWEYQNHCDSVDHKKGREERCEKTISDLNKCTVCLGRADGKRKTYLPYNLSAPAAPAQAVPAPSRIEASALSGGAGARISALSSSSTANNLPAEASNLSTSVRSNGASSPAPSSTTISFLERLEALDRPAAVSSPLRPAASSIASSSHIPAHRQLGRTASGPASAAHSASTSGLPSTSSGHAALRPTTSHNLPPSSRRLSTSLDRKPSLASLSAASKSVTSAAASTSSSTRTRSAPTYVDVLSSDEEVLPLSEAPEHMRKHNNAAAPILVGDSSDDEEDGIPIRTRPSSRLGLGSSQGTGGGSQGKGKGKQPLFRTGSGMSEGNTNAFEEMMSSSQPKVKREPLTLPSSSAASTAPAAPASAGAMTASADVKPNAETIQAIAHCRSLILSEKNAMDRLSGIKGKSYLADSIVRRRRELAFFEAHPELAPAYPRIPSTLVQRDTTFKSLSKMYQYKLQILEFRNRGVVLTADSFKRPPAVTPARAAGTATASASATAAAAARLTPAQLVDLRKKVSQLEKQFLSRMLIQPLLGAPMVILVAKRRTAMNNLNPYLHKVFPPVDPQIVEADASGKYTALLASKDYKLLAAWTPAASSASTTIGNGALAGPSGSNGASPVTTPAHGDVKPDVKVRVSGTALDQAKIDKEKADARSHIISEERKVINWLLARTVAPNLRALIVQREREVFSAMTNPGTAYPTMDPDLILFDDSAQFRMLSTSHNYRICTAYATGANADALIAQTMAEPESEDEMGMPVASTRAPPGYGSRYGYNAATASLLDNIIPAVNAFANNSPGGAFNPWEMPRTAFAAAPSPPAVEHGVNCECGEYCTYEDDPYTMPYAEHLGQQDMATFLQESFKDFSDDRTIDIALEKLGMADQNAKFADMKVQLMPHQILGVSFMLDKEKDRTKRGGLLCDAMGLGKTIACIAGNQSKDKKCKTTLIIAPLAVLTQWKAEIESKTAPGLFSVVIYHGTNKPKSRNILKNADVVLTTYHTMANESDIQHKKKKRGYGNQDPEEAREGDSDFQPDKKKGLLFTVRWYRIVLDEAHFIRNRNTKASKAVHELDAVYRWSLTGTLINNSLSDVFPHLRFLNISPQREWTEFSKTIVRHEKKHPKIVTKRIQAILRSCMMRRHKDSMLNGQRLLNLPPKTSEVVELEFTPEEREIYNAIEQRMKIRFGQFLQQGTVLKHLSCVLTMLMRLRQLTCHPWLLRRNPGDPAHPDDFQISDDDIFRSLNVEAVDAAADLANATNLLGQEWVDDMTKRLKDRYDNMVNAPKHEPDAEPEGLGECPICMEHYTDEVVTECRHSFCKGCLHELYVAPPRDATMLTDAQQQEGARNCPLCRGVIAKEKTFASVAFFDPEKEVGVKDERGEDGEGKDVDVKPAVDRKGKRKSTANDDDEDYKPDIKPAAAKKGKGRARAPQEEEEDELELDAVERVLPSTKMNKLKELLDEYLEEDGIKVIVFSEFVSYLDLVSVFLDNHGIKHSSYTGKMRSSDREDVVAEFTGPNVNAPRVLLISRKAGGAGLNLTAASKVISLDLAWNAASENQSVDRAHRIGQTRPVEVQRLVIANTVEQRILELQMKKEALSDGAMGEGNGGRLPRLNVADLMRLFNYDDEV